MQQSPSQYAVILLIILLLTGCAQMPGRSLQPEKPDPLMEQAAALETAGDHFTAAELFRKLAADYGRPLQDLLLLRAAENLKLAGDVISAEKLAAEVQEGDEVSVTFRKNLLMAEIALVRNRPAETLQMLASPSPADTALPLRQRYHQARAEAFRLTGNLLQGAEELEGLDSYLTEQGARLENQVAIVQLLSALTDTALELLQPKPPGIQGGWMELVRIIKGHTGDDLRLRVQVDVWRERFPAHPAMPELIEGYLVKLQRQFRQPRHLALLLPAKGPYAKAADALRDGFMAAYYDQPPASRPTITLYDSSNSADTWPLYRRALAEGAEMVVGPLSKESVSQLVRAGELAIPVLALNQVQPDVLPPKQLYQFALSPEDEARQVAERAWLDGLTRAAVITPAGEWGDRLLQGFSQRWEQLGGALVEYQSYNPGENDFAGPIRALLNLDESDGRHSQLQRLLGKRIEFEPRRRQDIDFIFMAAKPQKARQIRPQLQFHHASGVPVFTTSHSYSGKASPDTDQDLEGIRFPDIPWLLTPPDDGPLSRDRLAAVLPESETAYRRLYAMGIDSYNLLPHLERLQASGRESIDGQTGNLYLDDINHIHRQLVWAEIHRGVPRVSGYAPRLEMDDSRRQRLTPADIGNHHPGDGASSQPAATDKAPGESEAAD